MEHRIESRIWGLGIDGDEPDHGCDCWRMDYEDDGFHEAPSCSRCRPERWTVEELDDVELDW